MKHSSSVTPGNRALRRLLAAGLCLALLPGPSPLANFAFCALLLGYAWGWIPIFCAAVIGAWLAISPASALLGLGLLALALPTGHAPSLRPLHRALPWLWACALLVGIVLMVSGRPPPPELWIILVLSFSPAWIPTRRLPAPLQVFYDGECGFCHRSVQFLMQENSSGTAFRFSPLQGSTFSRLVPTEQRVGLPDSLILCDQTGKLHLRSEAALLAGSMLDGYWRPLAALGRVVPRALRDTGYDFFARNRTRWFGKSATLCPLLPPAQRALFDP